MNASLSLVPLEDWYEELGDESLDPLNILLNDEEQDEQYDVKQSLNSLENKMSTSQAKAAKGLDVKSWLATAKVISNAEVKQTRAIPCPEWLTLAKGTVCEANAFTVTAGVVKAARQVLDALNYTTLQHEAAVDALHMQEQRAARVAAGGPGANVFGPEITKVGIILAHKKTANLDVPGFNPDGVEFDEALIQAAEEVEKLESVLANGETIMQDILVFIVEYAEELNLQVEVGYTVKKGIIGNEIRSAKYELLNPGNLILAIDRQREFIRQARITKVNVGVQQQGVNEI